MGFLPLMGWGRDTNNGRTCWYIKLAPPNLVALTISTGGVAYFIIIMVHFVLLYYAVRRIMEISRNGANSSSAAKTGLSLRTFLGAQRSPILQSKRSWTQKILNNKKPQSAQSVTKWKAVKVVLFTSGSLSVAWLPFFVASFVYVWKCDKVKIPKCKDLEVLISGPLSVLGFVNTLINPIIYAWWHQGFRTSIKNIYGQFRRRKLALSEIQREQLTRLDLLTSK